MASYEVTHTVHTTTTSVPASSTTPVTSSVPTTSNVTGSTYDATYSPTDTTFSPTYPTGTTGSTYNPTYPTDTTHIPTHDTYGGAHSTHSTTTAPVTTGDYSTEKRVDSIFMTGPAGAPHYLRTIERDHNELKRLFAEYNSALSLREKDEIKNEIIRGTSIHDFITETVLFPAFEKEVPNGREMLNPFKLRLADLRKMLVQMDKMKIDDMAFQPTFQTLVREVEECMTFKERELLPALQVVISPLRAEELGRDMDKARRSAPTRPHTSAAKSSVLGALAAPIDKLKDKARDFAGASRENQDVVSK
jgi:hypothetical protein